MVNYLLVVFGRDKKGREWEYFRGYDTYFYAFDALNSLRLCGEVYYSLILDTKKRGECNG